MKNAFHLSDIKMALLVVILVFTAGVTTFAQSPKATGTPGSSDNVRNAALAKKQAILQAVISVKSMLDGISEIPDPQYRSSITAKAIDLIWKHDANWAYAKLGQEIDIMLREYETALGDPKLKPKRKKLAGGVMVLLKALAKRDVKAAERWQQNFFDLKQKYLDKAGENKSDLNDKLDLAKEGLDNNILQSVALVEQVIQSGIPSTFPQYLFDLKKKNPEIADNLYQKALTLMRIGRYPSSQAILLASYAFAETAILMPLVRTEGDVVQGIGIFTYTVNTNGLRANPALCRLYLVSVMAFLQGRLQTGDNANYSLSELLGTYFLLKKSAKYNALLRGENPERFIQLGEIMKGQILAADVGMDKVTEITGYAERSATQTDIFPSATSGELLSRSEGAENDTEKLKWLVLGAVKLVDEKKFDLAERTIGQIENSDIKEELIRYFVFYDALNSIDLKDWDNSYTKILRIADPERKIFLLLKASEVIAGKKTETLLTSYFLAAASKELNITNNLSLRAKGMLALAGISVKLAEPQSVTALMDAVKSINLAEDFDETSINLYIPIPGTRNVNGHTLDLSYEECFINFAKFDRINTQLAVDTIKDRRANALALIASLSGTLQTVK